jgi:hypothetical protein
MRKTNQAKKDSQTLGPLKRCLRDMDTLEMRESKSTNLAKSTGNPFDDLQGLLQGAAVVRCRDTEKGQK